MSENLGPRHSRYIPLVVQVLKELGGSATTREATRAVIELAGHTAEELDARHERTGYLVVENDIAWAKNTLVNNGIIDNSKRGLWVLTEKGLSVEMTPEETRRAIEFERELTRRRRESEAKTPTTLAAEESANANGDQAKGDLLSILQALPASGFERLAQELLRSCGFTEVEVTGRSGDGGIDGIGILEVNALVSFRVLFQCKRYTGTVPVKEVRDFRGAMAGRTDKGIIITTGSFTVEAQKEATRDGVTPIELVDGDKLVGLMEQFQVGTRPVTRYEIDHDFFDRFRAI